MIRSSPPGVFLRKGCLKICSKFTGEHPCQILISVTLQRSFIEITLWRRCSPVNLLHIFRTPFLGTSISGCFCINEQTIYMKSAATINYQCFLTIFIIREWTPNTNLRFQALYHSCGNPQVTCNLSFCCNLSAVIILCTKQALISQINSWFFWFRFR